MNLRPLLLIAGLASLALTPAAAPAAEAAEAVEPVFVALAPNVAMLRGPDTAVLLAESDDASILVDSELPKTTPGLLKALERRKPVAYVVNTHGHPDHVGGNQALTARGATLVAHENAWRRLSALNPPKRANPAPSGAARPNLIVKSDTELRLGTVEVRLIHVPKAHTDGDLLVYFPASNVLHMGDCFFNGMYPVIDTNSGGTVDGLIAALNRGLALADDKTQIVGGHGPIGGRRSLTDARDMLIEVRGLVARLKRAGKSREQVLQAAPTQDLDSRWGSSWGENWVKNWVKPAQIVGSVYDSLPAQP